MEAKQTMLLLERKGKAQTRKLYLRHGYAEPLFGVSFANLNALKKQIKTDHSLAEALWKTGNADARILATMVADPTKVTMELGNRWVRESNFRTLTEYVGRLVSTSPRALELSVRWLTDADPTARKAARMVLIELLAQRREVPVELLRDVLQEIERDIHTAENWTRYGMMYALIGIGGYCPELSKESIAAAKRIGKVDFDPGETSCKIPDPVPYIQKMVARRKAKPKKA